MNRNGEPVVPKEFIWRRLHSLLGIWLVLFLIVHLLVNAQAALPLGEDGAGFIHSANSLEALPFLVVLEGLVLGLPILIHLVWGVLYLRTAKYNSFATDGSHPSLSQYSRNHAYTWQRITAWLLIVGVLGHVIHMRFLERPLEAQRGAEKSFMVRVQADPGLYTLADRLNVKLYNQDQVEELRELLTAIPAAGDQTPLPERSVAAQQREQDAVWLQALVTRPLGENDVMAVAPDFGRAELLMLRETFKHPVMLVLYTLLVLTTCYHAFNGLWTALIKWGVTLSARSQAYMVRITTWLMVIVAFLGLAAVWGTYWINLRQ